MERKNKENLLHHSIIYKLLSGVLYLIAYPILFLITKMLLGLKIEGRENLEKVGDEYIIVANHVNTIDCAMIALSIFPRIPYFLTLQTNLEIPFIKYIVMLLRGIPIPKKISGKKKMLNTVDKLLENGEILGIYPEGHLIPYCDKLREFKDGAFSLAIKKQVPIVPIVFTYREVEDLRRVIKKRPFITLTILEPEYPNTEIGKKNTKNLKNKVYKKMNERIRKRMCNEELKTENQQEC